VLRHRPAKDCQSLKPMRYTTFTLEKHRFRASLGTVAAPYIVLSVDASAEAHDWSLKAVNTEMIMASQLVVFSVGTGHVKHLQLNPHQNTLESAASA
jgi:hypothetical protein